LLLTPEEHHALVNSRLNEDERFVCVWTEAMETCAMVLETHWPSWEEVEEVMKESV
jgi:hypothetical protein